MAAALFSRLPASSPAELSSPQRVKEEIETACSSSKSILGERLRSCRSLMEFYRARSFRLAWLTSDGQPLPQASQLVESIRTAWKDGLSPASFHLEKLETSVDSDSLIARDAIFSDAFLTLGESLYSGMLDPARLDIDWKVPRNRINMASELVAALNDGEISAHLTKLAPQAARYRELRAALIAYHSVGAPSEQARVLRQIRANLERLRWLPRRLGDRYLFVDIADFKLEGFLNGRRNFSSRIIVGDEYRRTPLLSSRITSLVVNPYWYIPRSILAAEILPAVRKDPRYLTVNGIRVSEESHGARREIDPLSVDWRQVKVDGSPYLFQMGAGSKNPLGRLKFVFPNTHAVYLHGTRDSRLFSESRRALSHGCIRVEDATGLAAYLLAEDSRSEREKVERAIEGRLETPIALSSPVPIYVWYRTARSDRRGKLELLNDVYGWDEIVANALEHKPLLVPTDLQLVIRGGSGPK